MDNNQKLFNLIYQYGDYNTISTIVQALSEHNVIAHEEGEWIYDDGFKLPRCSVCGAFSKDARREDKGNFCSACGAIMRPVRWTCRCGHKELEGTPFCSCCGRTRNEV